MSGSSRGASIVIPAHNEEPVIDRCLDTLARSAEEFDLDLDVIVVANGCTDRTVEVAGRHPGVRVIDEPTPSKRHSLNVGDRAARGFPRIYLDADVDVEPDALAALIEALDTPLPRTAAPTIRFDLTGASGAVRAFYRVFEQLPYTQEHLVGLGVYGMSRSGRERFGEFPDLIADDLFIQRLFGPDERLAVPGHFTVRVPRDLRNLVKVRTRVARGNAQVAALPATDDRFESSTGSTLRALRGLAVRRRPDVAGVAAYVGVTVAARLQARRSRDVWERDDSSRVG